MASCTDLNYEILDFPENDFVNVGPGARRGIEIIWGEDVDDYEGKIEWIVDTQEELFAQHNLDFFYWNGKYDKRLTLRDVEHSLCEYAKYHRVKHEDGSTRRFNHQTDEQSTFSEF